ncbi:MAG: chorismate synthase [Bacteroides sp.]|nr:chorismate synthase [Bacillota bacterium]MCM1393671.1 chorismate synthase [[Eubacterium] siraeum]MCM1455230.1 chorismate synthase [Bacteroides sp.]
MKANFEKLQIEIYGESHAPEIGVKIGGIPYGCELTLKCVDSLLERRRSHGDAWATARKEDDMPEIVGGLTKRADRYVVDGTIEMRIKNANVRQGDYANISSVPRPSHADYAAYAKDGKISSGGGRFSGRMTAPLCIAGGIAQELFESAGIRVCAYISEIAGVKGESYKDGRVALDGINLDDENRIKSSSFPLLDEGAKDKMIEAISRASSEGDSVGGVIECVVTGLETGQLGDALFEGLESKIAYAVYAIPAVKGVEFGSGFELSRLLGSEANDEYEVRGGNVKTLTNHSGGINGGISNGMPLLLRVAIKPTPSISKAQRSVELETMTERELKIKGRHDACIVPRAVPCVESAVSLALLDELLKLRDGIELYSIK